jgi:hypothetical protein
LECGSYVNVSLTLKNSMQTTTSSSPIIRFSNDGDGHWTYDSPNTRIYNKTLTLRK